jgi:glycine cleavage system H protein
VATRDDRKYADTHEWFKPDGEIVTIGITRFAVDELTDITFVDLPAAGTRVSAGSPFGEIESVKATSELGCAVDGEITEVNDRLADEPGLVNASPFDEGWMVRVRASSLDPLDALKSADEYDRMIADG